MNAAITMAILIRLMTKKAIRLPGCFQQSFVFGEWLAKQRARGFEHNVQSFTITAQCTRVEKVVACRSNQIRSVNRHTSVDRECSRGSAGFDNDKRDIVRRNRGSDLFEDFVALP